MCFWWGDSLLVGQVRALVAGEMPEFGIGTVLDRMI